MEPHKHDERCREVFTLLSDYLDVELPPRSMPRNRGAYRGLLTLHRVRRQPPQDGVLVPAIRTVRASCAA